MNFKNKIAFVSGAGSGIGKSTAVMLAAEGAHVILTDINDETGQFATKSIIDKGGSASYLHLDVSDRDAVIETHQLILREHDRLDLAVNNAGIGGKGAPTHEINIDDWNNMMAINLSGVFHCLQEQIKIMLASGGGKIVNVASLAGVKGVPGGAPYAAAKHAVVGLTKTTAIEYGKAGIKVNAVCPGFVETALLKDVPQELLNYNTNYQVPMKRLGKPEEIADAITWLLSDASSFVTGHTLYLDGGMMA